MNKGIFSYRFLIISVILFIMLSLGVVLYNYKNDSSNNTNIKFGLIKDSGIVFADSLDKKQDKDTDKAKELKKKVGEHIAKKIENDQDFWNYLKANHPNLYNSLNFLKSKYKKLYNYFSLKVYGIYKRMNREENNVIKDLLKEKIAIHDKIVKLISDYKEKRIQEKEFETNMKNHIKELLDNEEKILTERFNEFKAKKNQVAEDTYKKIKDEIDKFEEKEHKKEDK